MNEISFHFVLESPARLISISGDIGRLLGFTQDDFLSGRVTLPDSIHPGDEEIARSLFSLDRDKPEGAVRFRIRGADGRICCVKGQCTKTANAPDGELVLVLWDAREVEEPDDQFVIDSYKALLAQTSEYIYIKNRNHVVLAAGRVLAELTDRVDDAAALCGKTDYDLHPEREADRFYRLEEQLFAEGHCVNEIQQVIARDGSKRWIDNRKYPINGPTGDIVGILGIAPDITQHLEAEQKLRKSEESLRQAQKIAMIGNYTLDIQSGAWEGSEALDAILGISREHPRNVAGWVAILHPEDRESLASALAQEIQRQSTFFNVDYRIIRPSDGAVRWLKGLGGIEYAADGKPTLLHGTIQDITDSKTIELDLRQSKHLLELFIQHSPVALAMLDRGMRYLAVSERWLEIHELWGRDLIGCSHYDVFPNLPAAWKSLHRRTLDGEILPPDQCSFTKGDGSLQWIRRKLRPWFTGDGAIGGIILFSEDITAKKQNDERLTLAASVFTHAREGIVITDADGLILDVNDTFTRITGYSREEVIGRNPRILRSGLQNSEFYRKMWCSLIEDGQWSGEIWNRNKSGDIYPEMLTISAVRDDSSKVLRYIALFSDISELKEKQRQLEKIAHYDVLTGLPNRVLLADRLRQAMVQTRRRKQSLAVAYLDLDGFKAINDNHGHVVGDQVLSTLASRLKFTLRQGDTLARLGGDEFVALLLDLPETDDALPVVARLLESAAKPVRIGAKSHRVSASVGLVYYPDVEDVDADQLLRQADQAMYQAKLAGKNRYHVFNPIQDFSVRSRYESLEQVRDALAKCQLVLYYQPKVNLRTGDVIGVEALLRLQHPQRGLLSPALFMPATEDHPLSIEIGEWGIENALIQMEAWMEGGLHLPVSVNISGYHLQRSDFAARLRALLAAHPLIDPSMLELEVLESSALLDIMKASEVLEECHRIGVSIALDDFGTGYSSLTYLKQLPAHTLKIDRTFVDGMVRACEDLSIVEGVLSLAKAFRRQVIAEGVESVEHGVMLLKLGCERAQGYGISPPIPASEMPYWTATWRPDPRWAHVPPLENGNRSLLHACVEHTELLAQLEAFLGGKRHAPPSSDVRQCRLTEWLGSKIHSGHGLVPAIREIGSIHQQFHTAFQDVLGAYGKGCEPDSMTRLYQLRDDLLKQIETISAIPNSGVQTVSQRTETEEALETILSRDGKRTHRLYLVNNSEQEEIGTAHAPDICPN